MSGSIVGLEDRRSLTRQPAGFALRRAIAQLLLILLVASCANGLGRDSPTSPALPSFPTITPIMPQQEASPTPRASPTPPSTAEPTPESGDATTHTVQPGDTLLGLAKTYGIPMAAIQLENEMGESTVVQAGQVLSIPSREAWEGSSPFWIVHEVKPGETLIGIANDYDLEVERLQTVNGLDDADRITVGEQLILPLSGPAATATPPPTDTPRPTDTPIPTATPVLTATSSPTASIPSASSPTPVPPPTATQGAQALPPADLASWPQEIFRLINQVRAEHGLPPFAHNQTLAQAAQAHANDCAQRGWCSHTGSDGTNSKARILRAGYSPSGWAECWAQTQTPQKAVEVWMDETPPNDPHRRTLLSDWLVEVGIGVSEADWGHYIIADFGRP
jgi:uncharacterized protein YkwD